MPELTQAREHSKLILAREVLRSGGSLRLHALGTSMLPCIRPGDLLTLRSVPLHELAIGDVILFVQQERFFIHRVVGGDHCGWITRGDSVPENDPQVAAEEVLGKVTSIERNGRQFVPRRFGFAAHMLGLLLGHSDLARNLFLRSCRMRSMPSTDQLAGDALGPGR
jgi:hypothetical protein